MLRYRPSTFAPGSKGFNFVISMSIAVMALSIDSVLPAFGDIRAAMGLEPDSTKVGSVITVFFIGNGLGLLPAGVLSDRYGRRRVLWGGLALFIVGAIGAALAPTLGTMLVARFVWGLGSAGPRVAAMALVRDSFEGAQMAKQMSTIMAVFIIVPAIAPALGASVVAVGPWQMVYWMCVAAAVLVAVLALRLPPEQVRTAAPTDADGQPLGMLASCKAVLRTPGTPLNLACITILTMAFVSYLTSSEIVVDEVFDLKTWFPAIFGGFALLMGAGMLLNRRLVVTRGLDPWIRVLFVGYLAAALLLVVVSATGGGRPPFAIFAPAMGAQLALHTVLLGNINAAAMRPLGHIAGTAAALFGMVPSVIGAIAAGFVDRAFNGTTWPLSLAFVTSAVLATAVYRFNAHRDPARAAAYSSVSAAA